ncbi:hypothetical protein WJX72_004804 [[Myrmecia] bisecta]|uniref:t-SNARE coiled-coil homology domain-containing protein n=1 Tax=[Myrmecia] bisecta TaxID=41462 RepID=A0AAW1Q427_9CHLO
MTSPSQDPFYLVKDDIQASLDKAQAKFTRWQNLSKTSAERKRLEPDIDEECKSIAWQVDEMEKAVDVAEKNMQRFGLNPQEITNRRKWVYGTRRQIEGMMNSIESARHIATRLTEPSNAAAKLGAAASQENDRFITSEADRQQLLLRQQDDELDHLGEHVARIGHIGLQIHEELEQQGDLLDELDEDVEGTQTRLAQAQKKMNSVLQRAGLKGQICIIVFLMVTLVILVMLAFS